MQLSNKQRIFLLIMGVLILSVIAYYNIWEPSKKDTTEKLDYIGLSQKVKESMESYWDQQPLDFEWKSIWGQQKEKLVNGKQIVWQENSRELKLSFPTNSEEELDRLLAGLEKELSAIDVKLSVKGRITENGQEKVNLEVSFQPEEIDSESLVAYQLKIVQPEVKAKMAFIIDDLGFNRPGTEQLLSLDRQMTVAVLPFRPYSTREAKKFKEAGHQVLLHAPMEPVSSQVSPGEGAIYTDMSRAEIRAQLEKDIADLGVKIVGVNNHMGSKVTADKRVMKVVLGYLQEQDMFFIDSSTAPRSAIPVVAREAGEPYALNYLFIDNVDRKVDVKQQIKKLARVALRKGELITIGHVRPNTVQGIKEMIPKLEEMGIQLVYASELVK